ncbi:MAG: YfhO family protein [Eubacterium sp.]|nr:YfhO family protein [Eubacterium sp.]
MTEEKTQKKKTGFFGRNWSWIIAMAITAVFMLALMIYHKVAPFGGGSFTLVDSIHQYVPFLSDYQDKLKTGKSLAYTWDVGLGQNFQSLLLYYMASPLNLIIVFFTRKGIIAMFSSLVSVKIIISAGLFGLFLSRRKDKPQNNFFITALSLGYALNNYICGYYWNLNWLDCIMIFPLIILGYEKLIAKKDPRLYTIALFYSMFCNYYISFIICIFLVLWFLATGHENFKKFIFDGLRFAGCSILAAGMSAIALLTAYLAITKTASSGTAIPDWNWYQGFLEMLKSHFFLSTPVTMDSFDGSANLYAGTLTLMMTFIYICSNKIPVPEKIRKVLLVAFMIVSMNQEKLNFIWHGFHNQYGIPNRFSFLYIFVTLLMCYEAMSKLKKTHIVSIISGVLLCSGFLAVVYYKTNLEGLYSAQTLMIISYSLITVYAILLLLRREDVIPAKATTIIIGSIMSVEILINAWAGIADHGVADGEYYMEYADTMESVVSEVEEKAEEKGLKFYRQEIVSPRMLDENTFDNMKSLGTFCSTVRGDMVDTMAYMGFYTGANEYLYNGASPVTNDILGIRYIYLRDGDYFPAQNDYKLLLEDEGTRVYENESALPVAFAVDEDASLEWDFATYKSSVSLNGFAKNAAGVGDIYREVHPVYAVNGENCMPSYNDNSPDIIGYSGGSGDTISIDATTIMEEDGRYFLNCRANYIDNIVYYLNGEQKASGRYETQLMDLGELSEGDEVRICIQFSDSYSPSGTVSMYMSQLDKDALAQLRAYLSKHDMVVSEVTDNTVKGKINLEEGQIIFTSIPYDEGWKVYIDGEKQDPEELDIICGGLLGIWAEPGTHEIYLKYVPPGRILGIIITIISWMIYVVITFYYVRYTKKKDEKKVDDNSLEKSE